MFFCLSFTLIESTTKQKRGCLKQQCDCSIVFRFGVLRDGLFTKAYAGTKAQIEHYNETVVKALKMICDSPSTSQDMAQPSSSTSTEEAIPTDVKLAFFNEMRHAYGRTALMMSGGASLGYYHIGMVGALLEQGLLPRVISGSR